MSLRPASDYRDCDMFDQRALDRCRMSEKDAVRFKNAAGRHVFRDARTGGCVIYYEHPDGRILIDSITP